MPSSHKNSHCYNVIIAQKLTLLQCRHQTKAHIVTMSSPHKLTLLQCRHRTKTHFLLQYRLRSKTHIVTMSSPHKNSHCYNVITAPKQYFLSPGISWKAQKYQTNTIFPSTFRTKNRSNFPSQRSSKQEFFPYSVNMVFHPCLRKYHLIGFLRTERSSFSVLKTS